MSALVALSDLRTRVRFEADMVNSTRATDADITRVINTQWAELYDRLVAAGPPDYYLSTATVSIVQGTSAYPLPSDFRSLLGVFQNVNTRLREIRPLGEGLRSAVDVPTQTGTLTIEYVPKPTVLVTDADTIDGVSGWDELVVLLSARVLLRRERRDTSQLESAINEARNRVMSNAPKRDQSGPRFVNDVEAADEFSNYAYQDAIFAYRLSAGYLNVYSLAPLIP